MINLQLQTLISLDRLANLIRYSVLTKELEGDVCEFGVFRGGSLELLAELNPHKNVIGVDSFEGLPTPIELDSHLEGDFKETDYEALRGYFKTIGSNVELVKGFSPNVFKNIHPYKRFSLVHVDVDLYNSCMDAADFFYPRLVDGGVMIWDDYGFDSTKGAKKAIDEFSETITPTFKGELMYSVGGESHKQYLIIK